MSVKQKKSPPAAVSDSLVVSQESPFPTPAKRRVSREAAIAADARLAKRCFSGEVAAWEELYAQCHYALLNSIRILLRPSNGDFSLVDEIAARVWYALVANDGALLSRYDPKRGVRLVTFLRALAKDEICRHFRERISVQDKLPHHTDDPAESEAAMAEFWDTLTNREKDFAQEHLLAEEQPANTKSTPPCSQANVWQLTHRIYRKFIRFFNCDPS
jgi:hypothetical protein